jgi:phosphatidate cytidylyltransferase
MRTRVISAIVMIAAGGVLIYFGDIYFGAAIFLCSVIGLFEFYRAFKGKGYRPVQIIGYLYTLLIPAAIFLNPSHALDVPVKGTNLFPVFQLLVMLLLLTLTVVAHKKVTPMDCAVTLMGAFYVPFLFSFFVLIRDMDDGLALFLIGILGSVAADTVALFSGILWGRKKLIPDISPKKTVAGSIGSFVGSTLAVTIYGLILHYTKAMIHPVPVLHFALLGLLMGGSSQIGDLSASAIKRYCGIKDFGKLIPGHGGILDRFDSMLFNVPIVYCYIQLFKALAG